MRRTALAFAMILGVLPFDLSAQTGAYRTTVGGTTIAAEAFRWVGQTLEATADMPTVGRRLVTRTVYDSAYAPVSYDLRVLTLATGDEQQAVHTTFGDSVRWTVVGRASGALAVAAPRAVMQNLLWSHLAAMLRRLPAGDTSLTLHTVLVDRGAAMDLVLARRGTGVTATIGGLDIVLVPSADGDLASASVASQNLVVERVPAESVSASRDIKPAAPAPPPAGVVEEPYAWTDGPQPLAGTLAMPARPGGRVPVVLIVAGSGPTDRDGNSRAGLRTDLYKKLAWALAGRGIASVRYDKRGTGASALVGDVASLTFDDFAGDVREGALALSRDRRFSKVVLLGHSEGAALVTYAASRGAPAAGVVMLAGVGRPFGTVLREQVARQLDSLNLAAFDRTLAAYLGDGPMPEVPEMLQALFPASARRFVQSEAGIDFADEARRVPVPLLVVQGATDVQVSVVDADAIHAARPDAQVHILPAANHLFVRAETADRIAQLGTYSDPALPLVPELVPLVADFVARVTR